MMQLTGNGGVHRVYRRPRVEDVPYIGNRQKTWIGGRQYNLDVRGDGGYIMAPGSIHPTTGQLYREEVPWTLDLLMQCPVYDPTGCPVKMRVSQKAAEQLSWFLPPSTPRITTT